MPLSNVLPKELCCAPKPYIVLTGLDITFNAVHKSIWDAFSNNRYLIVYDYTELVFGELLS